MNKKLIVYFSATGFTKKLAEEINSIINCDMFEIIPEKIYTKDDLNWMNKNSRSSIEMSDLSFRPKIQNKLNNLNEYDTIYLGFPIWWDIAPTIVNTFLESYDFSNKTIIPFCTSGSSGIGDTVNKLKSSVSSSTIIQDGKRFSNNHTIEEVSSWLNE